MGDGATKNGGARKQHEIRGVPSEVDFDREQGAALVTPEPNVDCKQASKQVTYEKSLLGTGIVSLPQRVGGPTADPSPQHERNTPKKRGMANVNHAGHRKRATY